jgi:hypothetical protein
VYNCRRGSNGTPPRTARRFVTAVKGGYDFDGTNIWHESLLGAITFHDLIVGAFRDDQPVPVPALHFSQSFARREPCREKHAFRWRPTPTGRLPIL